MKEAIANTPETYTIWKLNNRLVLTRLYWIMARYFSEGMYLNEAIVELQRAELCIPNDDRSVALLHQNFGAIYGERYAAWEQESDLNIFISSGQKAVTYEANLHDKCGVYVEMSQMLVTCHVPSCFLGLHSSHFIYGYLCTSSRLCAHFLSASRSFGSTPCSCQK